MSSTARRRVLQILIVAVLVAAGFVGMERLKAGKKQMKKQKPLVQAPLVRTMKIHVSPQPILVQGEGTVKPFHQINLIPQVSGKAIFVSRSMVDGGEFRKGDVLLRIDPVDYQLAVTLAQAALKDAESTLRLTEEEAAAAKYEWRLLYPGKKDGAKGPSPLAAKEPQLAAARARLAAAGADLEIAKLSLDRTVIRAPFSGRFSQESVDRGQFVAAGQSLAMLYSTEAVEIVVPMPDEDLFWFHVPGFTPGKGPGSKVLVKARIAGRDMSWTGTVVRAEGRMDERTRMIDVLVHVEKAYEKKPPLAIGLFVTVEIQGSVLPNVAIIPRAALRQGNTVWVVDGDGRLRFRKVEVALLEDRAAFIKAGLEEGEDMIISSLQGVTDGMKVRTIPAQEANGL
ncbi:MAG: efflux RND transporter periplasmic adaptor subunit [Deltaproteobacteria bacterium]|nr:efflux RND transporter periplasmic adaptor subunit [Deltaproteobacteria bacterium]